MPSDTIYKTIHQYNKFPISETDMDKLIDIAKDYRKVKSYVYQRYGGIKSLPKLYPGYTIQNEMTKSGLRSQLRLPSVYFYLAVFEALGDIKSHWTQTKEKVLKKVSQNENFTPREKQYLRFVVRQSQYLEGVLLRKEVKFNESWEKAYQENSRDLDIDKLNKYLCRQVRKHLKKLYAGTENGFSISERAYRYGKQGIYISTKESRKRIYVPLTDNNQYKQQLYIVLKPEEKSIILKVPIQIAVKRNRDYTNKVGLAVGMDYMFVSDKGNNYGENYTEYQYRLNNYIAAAQKRYSKNKKDNPGRNKYFAGKRKLEAALHTYINSEINKMLQTEKPETLYIPKLPQNSGKGVNKQINHSITMWQRGYIRKRLVQKCREQSITVIEVFGKDISNECSRCGHMGNKNHNIFFCESCGLELPSRVNTARNSLKRGLALQN